MSDVHRYAGHLRVEVLANDKRDAADTLSEMCARLFGEEHVVTIICPDPESIQEVKS